MKTLLFSTLAAIIALLTYAGYEPNKTEVTLPFAPVTETTVEVDHSQPCRGIFAVYVDDDYSAISGIQVHSWMHEIKEITEVISYMKHAWSITIDVPSKGIHNLVLPITKDAYKFLIENEKPVKLHFYYDKELESLGMYWHIRPTE